MAQNSRSDDQIVSGDDSSWGVIYSVEHITLLFPIIHHDSACTRRLLVSASFV